MSHKSFNIYCSILEKFHRFVYLFGFVINVFNCRDFWTPCISESSNCSLFLKIIPLWSPPSPNKSAQLIEVLPDASWHHTEMKQHEVIDRATQLKVTMTSNLVLHLGRIWTWFL